MDRLEEYFRHAKNGEIYAEVIDNIEKILIEKALESSYGNKMAAAKMLGINRNTLHAKIKKLGIYAGRFKI